MGVGQCDRSEAAASSPRARTGSRSGCWSASRVRAGGARFRARVAHPSARSRQSAGGARLVSFPAGEEPPAVPGAVWRIRGDEPARSDTSLQQSRRRQLTAQEADHGSCRTQLSRIPTYKRLLLQAQGFLHADLQTQYIHYVVTKNLHHTRCAGPLPGPSSSASGVERPSAAASQQNALPAKGLAYKSACMDYPDRRKHGQRRRSEPDHRRIGHVNSHSIRAAE